MNALTASQQNRLDRGGVIDRSRVVTFSFNGHRYEGYAGDTLASALIANGVQLVARSWKYHRPRGFLAAGVEEPNAVVQLGEGALTIPNARATEIEIYEGLVARSVNCWPSVSIDVSAISGYFSRLLPAGFYYKTFMWPKSAWMQYEHLIRKASGLGQSPVVPDPETYEKSFAFCDVLVVGAGPAGLSAALVAARSGARVIVTDEQRQPGGSLTTATADIDGMPALQWVAECLSVLNGYDRVKVMQRSTAYAYLDHNMLAVCERLTDHLPVSQRQGPREKLWKIRARQVVLATGAHERPLVFGNNDRPGIMLASAVSTWMTRYAVRPGRKAVVFTNNDSAYATALDMLDAGVEVSAVVDVRRGRGGDLPAAVQQRGVTIYKGYTVVNTAGRKSLTSVTLVKLNDNATGTVDGSFTLECDLLAVSGGWSPVVHLSAQSGARAVWDDELLCYKPGIPVQHEVSAGAAAGLFDLAECLADGYSKGQLVAENAGFKIDRGEPPFAAAVASGPIQAFWNTPAPWQDGRGPKKFVDFQNDVATSDIQLAAREGFRSIEHVKRYTAMGFGTDQGKTGNINGMALLAETLDQSLPETGTTTFRPNYTPVSFGTVAGPDSGSDFFQPVRKTALHGWHEENGALFEDVGQWKRPWYFPRGEENMHEAVSRECLAVRNSVGIIDASTLGKIDIRGPDSAEFLNRIYTNAWKKLKVNHARYGLMLGEDGMLMDDGVTIRLAEDHFFMHTTTGGATSVMAWLERWLQTEWPELQVYLTSVTDHWATAAVVGPNSRKVVSAICPDVDFSAAAFPFMTSREGTVSGIQGRINRISFSGELAYEVNVPANYGRHVWEALMVAGRPYNITPYGTETMHVLRAEKGYVIVGQDTDGSVTPADLGMSWALSSKKDFIGKRSLSREDTARTDRKQLVGLLTEQPDEVIPEGAQIVEQPDAPIPIPMIGHVTSSYFSAYLGRSIALALIRDGFNRKGEHVYAPLADGKTLRAEITDSVFVDPEGARQNA